LRDTTRAHPGQAEGSRSRASRDSPCYPTVPLPGLDVDLEPHEARSKIDRVEDNASDLGEPLFERFLPRAVVDAAPPFGKREPRIIRPLRFRKRETTDLRPGDRETYDRQVEAQPVLSGDVLGSEPVRKRTAGGASAARQCGEASEVIVETVKRVDLVLRRRLSIPVRVRSLKRRV